MPTQITFDRLRIHGESILEYSLGSPLDKKGGDKDGGVRVWLRTEAEVTAEASGWYPATYTECLKETKAREAGGA